MQLSFLGTSAGTPTRSRNVTGLALQADHGSDWYLIDCGEGTQHQLLRTSHSLSRLRAVFITHVHADHTLGLPGLLATASMEGRAEALTIIAPGAVRTLVETALACTDSELGFALQFIDTDLSDDRWADRNFQVSQVALSHRVSCRAFVFTECRVEGQLMTEKLKADEIAPGPAWGQLQRGHDVMLDNGTLLRSSDYVSMDRQPRRVVVAGDNDRPELLADVCRSAHVLVHEATYTRDIAERVGSAPQHSAAGDVAAFAQSQNLPNLVLTHFSPRYQSFPRAARHIDEIADEARLCYTGNLFLAEDFAKYRLHRDGRLEPGNR